MWECVCLWLGLFRPFHSCYLLNEIGATSFFFFRRIQRALVLFQRPFSWKYIVWDRVLRTASISINFQENSPLNVVHYSVHCTLDSMTIWQFIASPIAWNVNLSPAMELGKKIIAYHLSPCYFHYFLQCNKYKTGKCFQFHFISPESQLTFRIAAPRAE